MSKIYTLAMLLFSSSLIAQVIPKEPDYGNLLLVETRLMKPHFELGLDGGIALDNSYEDVYSLNAMGNYLFTPIFSLGLEFTYNKTEEKSLLKKLEEDNELKITNFTPDWLAQITMRLSLIKGHLNIVNKWHSPFELAAILGGGTGYNEESSKSSSVISWGGEILVPVKEEFKVAIGIRHYKSYPFQSNELSFTSLLVGIRKSL